MTKPVEPTAVGGYHAAEFARAGFMPDTRRPYTDFRRRLKAREYLLGTFVKTPTTHATEILGMLGFDFVIIDQEHAPIDRGAIDVMVLAARASNTAGIVRVGDPGEANILSVLDCGASGIFVPHVDSPGKARISDGSTMPSSLLSIH